MLTEHVGWTSPLVTVAEQEHSGPGQAHWLQEPAGEPGAGQACQLQHDHERTLGQGKPTGASKAGGVPKWCLPAW